MNTKTARQLGEGSDNACLSKAERIDPEWSDSVLHMLRWFGKIRVGAWTCEDFREWAHARGLERPHDNRAIGALIAKAIRIGIIKPTGFAPTVSSHGSPRRTYIKGRQLENSRERT